MIEVRTVTVVTCNRCGHEDNWTNETPDYLKFEWGRFEQGYRYKGDDVEADLCPACTREVKAWIRNGR